MKALVIHGPGEYRFEEQWPQPVQPDGWALVRVRFCGICGSDLARFATTGSYHHPMVLGHEFAGIVERPAAGSGRFAAGDRVAVLPLIPCGSCEWCRAGEPFHCANYQFLGSRNDGGFAELCAVPEDNLVPLPAEAPLRLAAMIEPIGVALHVVRRSGFAAGQDALVLGAGSIGLLVGLWLKVFGARRVVMSDLRPASLEMAAALGFDSADATAELPDESFDAAFEAAGATPALLRALRVVRRKGRVTVVGRAPGDTSIPHELFELFMRKEVDLSGCWGYNLARDLEYVTRRMADGSLPAEKLITDQVALADAPDLVARMISGTSYYCKAMVEVTR